jgi:hypothetical protein
LDKFLADGVIDKKLYATARLKFEWKKRYNTGEITSVTIPGSYENSLQALKFLPSNFNFESLNFKKLKLM